MVINHGVKLSLKFVQILFPKFSAGKVAITTCILITTHLRHPKLCMQILDVDSLKTVMNVFLISTIIVWDTFFTFHVPTRRLE